MKTILLVSSTCILFCACRTHSPEVTSLSIKGERLEEQRGSLIHDSIHVYHNSIERMVGDTFVIRDSVVIYKIIRTRDSVFTHKVDTLIRVQKVQVVQKERYIPRWCKWFSCIGITITALSILYLAFRWRKTIISLIP